MGALHQPAIALTVLFEESPRIIDETRCGFERIGGPHLAGDDAIWLR
jgi:hypothetical protein